METDKKYMERAISLARNGLGSVSPNPMVGAVLVCDDRIVGEGWHRRYGSAHAEVNAVDSVVDKQLLRRSTLYVTLEPCSHYGKTPPCAKLIIDSRIPHVVVGSPDPFAAVSGRGIGMLRDAGVEVEVGILERECVAVNPFFMTAHTQRRPWVTLKWAQSADGYIDRVRSVDCEPARFSTAEAVVLTHRLRSLHDAILVGRNTYIADTPSLTVRDWSGRSPRRYVADRSRRLMLPDGFGRLSHETVPQMLDTLYAEGVTSLLVEGGATLHQAFIDAGMADLIRVETSPVVLGSGVKSPVYAGAVPVSTRYVGDNRIDYYGNMPWFLSWR